MLPSLACRSTIKIDAIILSLLTGVILSEIVLTTAQHESQMYISLRNFREPRSSLRLLGIRSSVECCVACEMNTTCKAANFHAGDGSCELIEPGTTLLSPEASTGWTFYYTDSKYLHKLFNAFASQKSTRHGAVAGLAIDGNTNPSFSYGSCTHTDKYSPWWLVDLFLNFHVETVIMWNRLDCCYNRLESLTITISSTISGVDDQSSICATYPGPPSSSSDNPVVVNCNRIMLGRYVKILKHTDEALHLCEVELA